MKKMLLLTALIPLLASQTFAGSDTNFVIAFTGAKSTATSLIKKADYLSVPLTISSKQKDPSKRFSEIRKAQDLIVSQALNHPDLLVHKGAITLSPRPTSKLSYSSGGSSKARFHLLTKMKKDEDVYESAIRVRQFIAAIELPGKSTHAIGQLQLAVDNPERYRKELLEKISKDVAFIKSSIGTKGKAFIKGLERPVLVRQVDDRNVELFIHYELTIEMSSRSNPRVP